MELTAVQRAMLRGEFGRGKAMAMQIQVGIGTCFEAPRLAPIQKAHVSLSAQEADIWFSGRLLEAGARRSLDAIRPADRGGCSNGQQIFCCGIVLASNYCLGGQRSIHSGIGDSVGAGKTICFVLCAHPGFDAFDCHCDIFPVLESGDRQGSL